MEWCSSMYLVKGSRASVDGEVPGCRRKGQAVGAFGGLAGPVVEPPRSCGEAVHGEVDGGDAVSGGGAAAHCARFTCVASSVAPSKAGTPRARTACRIATTSAWAVGSPVSWTRFTPGSEPHPTSSTSRPTKGRPPVSTWRTLDFHGGRHQILEPIGVGTHAAAAVSRARRITHSVAMPSMRRAPMMIVGTSVMFNRADSASASRCRSAYVWSSRAAV